MTRQTETLEAALPRAVGARVTGAWVPIRNLSPQHRPRISDHLLALNERDRLLRFGMLATDEQTRGYVDHIDFERDLVSVVARARGRGYGARLFDHAVTHARNRGAKTMMIHIARDNTAMLGIVRRAGADVQFDGSEAIARLLLPQDTLGSQIEELVGHQAAEMDYRIKMQVLRLDRLRPPCLRQPADKH